MTGFGVGELKVREAAQSDSKYFERLVQAIPKAGDGDFPYVLVVDEANTLKELAYQDRTVSVAIPVQVLLSRLFLPMFRVSAGLSRIPELYCQDE